MGIIDHPSIRGDGSVDPHFWDKRVAIVRPANANPINGFLLDRVSLDNRQQIESLTGCNEHEYATASAAHRNVESGIRSAAAQARHTLNTHYLQVPRSMKLNDGRVQTLDIALTNGELSRLDLLAITNPNLRQIRRIQRFVREFGPTTQFIVATLDQNRIIDYVCDLGLSADNTTDGANTRREAISVIEVKDTLGVKNVASKAFEQN